MSFDAATNFAKATVSTGYDNVATTVVLSPGGGARFPAAPFNAVWFNSTDYHDPADDGFAEIIRVTVRVGDTLTVTRAQEGTSAQFHDTVGKVYTIIAGPTAKLVNTDLNTLIRQDGTLPLTANWDAGNYRIDGQTSSRWHNIIAYGADPTGANAATTTSAIRTAITAALSTGGTLYVPRGVFAIDSTIVLGAFGTATRGLTIRGEAGSYAAPGSWLGSNFLWAGSGASPMFWIKNFQYLQFLDLGFDGANVASSTAMLWDNDGTAGAATVANAVRGCHLRRFHDGICVGSLTAASDVLGTGFYVDHPNSNTVDTLTLDKVSWYESITAAEGAAMFLNCPNFTGSRFSNLNIFQWRYGVWLNGSAAAIAGGFSMSDSTFGTNGLIDSDFIYNDHRHGLITLDNCEAEQPALGHTQHYIYVPSTAVANTTYPFTVRNSNTTDTLIQQTQLVLTENCNHAGVITMNTNPSKWTSINDTFGGGAPVIGGGTVFTRQNGAGLGTQFSGYVPPMGFTVVGSGGGVNNATNAYVDVTNCTVTFTPAMDCRAMITATFDTAQTAAGGDICVGTIAVNGTDQTPTANWQFNTNGFRSPMTQNYAIDLTGGVSYTIKQRFKCVTGGATTFTVYPTNTTMNITLLGRY